MRPSFKDNSNLLEVLSYRLENRAKQGLNMASCPNNWCKGREGHSYSCLALECTPEVKAGSQSLGRMHCLHTGTAMADLAQTYTSQVECPLTLSLQI